MFLIFLTLSLRIFSFLTHFVLEKIEFSQTTFPSHFCAPIHELRPMLSLSLPPLSLSFLFPFSSFLSFFLSFYSQVYSSLYDCFHCVCVCVLFCARDNACVGERGREREERGCFASEKGWIISAVMSFSSKSK